MKHDYHSESPLVQLVSFNKLLEHYDEQLKSSNPHDAERAKYVLEAQAPYPELREGFSDLSLLDKYKDVIRVILEDSFSPILTKNEIKTASTPFENLVFNSSERFRQILKDAGDDFDLEITNIPREFGYIMRSTVILKFYYGYNLDFRRPFFYDIPDTNGVMRRYRILYNADFMEIIPTDKAKEITQDDVDELLDNFYNLDLWKKKIPPNSFIAKGFVISNMFDVTAEHSVSEIKSTLIGKTQRGMESFMENFEDTFRSFFRLNDIKVGFAGYDSGANHFFKIYGKGMESYILNGKDMEKCDSTFCNYSHGKLFKENKYFAISNVEKYFERTNGKVQPYRNLMEQGIKSAILAPITVNGELLGVLELVSGKENELNSVNANKLDDVMPYIIAAVMRTIEEEENLIDAVIQHECTSVHPSVYWKFQEEAKRFMADELAGNEPVFKEIVFKDVYPLYGQIDIKDSAKQRNLAIQRDLMIQLSEINDILEIAFTKYKLPIYEELMFRVNNYLNEVKEALFTHTEQAVFDFVKEEVDPVFNHLQKEDGDIAALLGKYNEKIDKATESYYDHRRNYDNSVMEANMKLATLLDKKQEEAQEMFPHYFERYKTDGVEHNMYIGSSIAKDQEFNELFLSNLRLWQLQVMCEMENKYYSLKPHLPVKLDVASLVLVYSTSLAIRFRMDEKRFDVDGTYNARYEVIKKRIDKSYIKGTNERLTQKGKLAIVYSQRKDEKEYLRYISFLKAKGYFTNNIEIVELEGVQGVSGLKAIRAEILYQTDKTSERTYTYDDLMEELSK
ncbi:MAG: GAF domain-containing protein [Bacteroidota bacterium]|uniref:GAF domain-containing protein n=1 Tax=Flagellimonas profundi TaxID=2915620 RepID=A0ABS3FJ67_9FLAO|nr:GAF domain-containing protein [Allomuricauda profundi]MBO0343230.1 GAF domain-containing protein [Allomuricauda profundi]MEC7770462.1 GAF domain-containing protein [Bacteroidota bacterium]